MKQKIKIIDNQKKYHKIKQLIIIYAKNIKYL
jgi:hypothetical protein